MAFRSRRVEVEREIDERLRRKNERAGLILANEIKKSIAKEGLIDTGRYIGSITSDHDQTGAVAGTNVENEGFSYPTALEFGTRNMRPYSPMRKAAIAAIPDLRRNYQNED